MICLDDQFLLCDNEVMHCPRCKHPNFNSNGTCPRCGFYGDPGQIEHLWRLDWLLGEMSTWVDQGILKQIPKRLQKHYETRRQEVLSALKLNYAPFTDQEAARAWPELHRYELLFHEIELWRAAGEIRSGYLPRYYARLIELRDRIANYRGAPYPETDHERLEVVNFVLSTVESLASLGEFTNPRARYVISQPFLA